MIFFYILIISIFGIQILNPYFHSETLSLETQEMLGVSGNGVLVKVEPQATLGQPRQYQPSVKGSIF